MQYNKQSASACRETTVRASTGNRWAFIVKLCYMYVSMQFNKENMWYIQDAMKFGGDP